MGQPTSTSPSDERKAEEVPRGATAHCGSLGCDRYSILIKIASRELVNRDMKEINTHMATEIGALEGAIG